MTHHESLLRQYLLGQLDEPSRERLENEMLEQDALFEQVEALDADVMLDLARGDLPAEAAAKVRSRLLSSREGRREWAFHRTLADWLASRAVESSPSDSVPRESVARAAAPRPAVIRGPWTSHLISGLAAALLALAAALPIFWASQSALEDENRSLSRQLASVLAAEASAPLRSTFFLSPLTRSGKAASYRLGQQTEFVELWLEPPYEVGPYRVEVRQAGQALLEREAALVNRDWGAVVAIELPTHLVSGDPLEIVLERFDGSWSAAASYAVKFEKN